jgi:hypothetical protein
MSQIKIKCGTNGLQIGGRFNAANVLLAAVFISLIISTLENNLKISLK